MRTTDRQRAGLLVAVWLWLAPSLVAPCAGQAFSHDASGRLLSVVYDGAHSVACRYDTVGNLTNLVVSGTQAETDSESDGLADAWEWVWFNNLTNTAAGDFNQDTISNLQHYQDGTDPTDPDSDGDGMSNTDELLAGTQPTNAASVFQVSRFEFQGSAPVVRWDSVTGKSYRLSRSSSPVTNYWLPIAGSITGIPPQNVYTDTTASGSGPLLYRVQTE